MTGKSLKSVKTRYPFLLSEKSCNLFFKGITLPVPLLEHNEVLFCGLPIQASHKNTKTQLFTYTKLREEEKKKKSWSVNNSTITRSINTPLQYSKPTNFMPHTVRTGLPLINWMSEKGIRKACGREAFGNCRVNPWNDINTASLQIRITRWLCWPFPQFFPESLPMFAGEKVGLQLE